MIREPEEKTSDMLPVHAVLLNWNSFDYTRDCITSLQRSRYALSGIIVVDNGSSDGSIERLMSLFRDSQVTFIRHERNLGFAGGMNIGIQRACDLGAALVYTINNDTVTDPDCIGLLVEALSQDPSAGIAGPAIMYYNNPERIWLSGGFFSRMRAGVVVPGKGKRHHELGDNVKRVDFLTGCALLTRTDVYKTIGLLDTSYFFYSEDLDFALRAREAGFNLLFVPKAKVWHKIEDVARDRTSPYVLYHLARSTTLLYRKRFSIPYRWYAIVVLCIAYTPFRLYQIVKGRTGLTSFWAWLKGIGIGLVTRTDSPPAVLKRHNLLITMEHTRTDENHH